MDNEYYVYEWIRLDTNEPFYIGKGKGNRWCALTRGNNKHFNRIVKNYPVAVSILEDNLDEKTAYEYEIYYINEYKNMGLPLVNITDGGDGVTLVGEKNPMYGRPWWDENTPPEKIEKWKKKIAHFGESNGNYGREYTEEEREKMRKAKKGKFLGKDNPNYGNDTLKKKLQKHPELKKEYYSRPRGQNGRAKKVSLQKDDLYKEFDCLTDCSQWLVENGFTKAKNLKGVSDNIVASIKRNGTYLKIKFAFI